MDQTVVINLARKVTPCAPILLRWWSIYLAEADRHIREVQHIIARQRRIIAELKAKGRNTADAETEFGQFVRSLEVFKVAGNASSMRWLNVNGAPRASRWARVRQIENNNASAMATIATFNIQSTSSVVTFTSVGIRCVR
jgi:hypothetical protein